MGRGRTLWEMLMDKVLGPVELRYENPLRARVGSSVMINELDLKELNFFIKEMRVYRRQLGRAEFPFVDYLLLAHPLGQAEIWVRLRLVPHQGDADAAGLTHHGLLLRKDDDFAYDEGFHKVLTDTTRKFQVLQGGQVTEEFFRINDVADPYDAAVSIIEDENSDGRVTSDEVETVRLQYWDFMREVKDEAGQPQRQYLFVEMDQGNGWFQIWRGSEVDPQKVIII